MSYYMGDYYRGRGGRGDPFSIGGMIGGIGRVLTGAAGGLITGGPLGAITGGIRGIMGKPAVAPGFPGVGAGVGGGFRFEDEPPPPPKKPGIRGVMERLVPGGASGYYARRRMNVTNPRALRRAIRRVSGFGKLVQRSKRAIARANTAVGNKARGMARRAARR
jgi:hypothetical protein